MNASSRPTARCSLTRAATLIVVAGLLACATPEPPAEPEPLTPPPEAPVLDERTALSLAALPLACIDRPHPAPRSAGYLYEREATLRPDFEQTLAFYGCYDWHSAVNSTWTLVALMRRFPDLPIAPLIVEKLGQHLSATAMNGEEQFFADDRNGGFERPYGWAWLLALHVELRRLATDDAATWADNTAPLAARFAAGIADFADRLEYPNRVGTHANTAFALDLALEYARATESTTLEESLRRRARELYLDDTSCGLAYEPSASDFFSPCLEEAKLMAAILPAEELADWLDAFLPPLDSAEMLAIAEPLRLGEHTGDDIALDGARSHLIGLAFTRAEALARLARALPLDDPRVEPLDLLAAAAATHGLDAMFEADYLGSHWLATFAVRYLVATHAAP
jgi:hypothetical protein